MTIINIWSLLALAIWVGVRMSQVTQQRLDRDRSRHDGEKTEAQQ
jgi:hypothetical protein